MEQGQDVVAKHQQLCGREGLAGHMLRLVDAFGNPDHLLPPIARDCALSSGCTPMKPH